MLALLGAASLSASQRTPTTEELESALANAKLEWRADLPELVEFRLEPLNACDLKQARIVAVTQPYDVITTLVYDDGSAPAVSKTRIWIIRINSSCDWSRLDIRNVVIHEVGHILIGPDYHSADKRSVMSFLVNGKQAILPEDRARVVQR